MALTKGDVVQLDPKSELGQTWGPQFVVVDEVRSWGFQGYFIHAAASRDFGRALVRVREGSYAFVGRAVWYIE